jgi:hypothetical protein
MIAIVNIGPQAEDAEGERNYELRINREVLLCFKHKRSDGLSACLRAAADAFEHDNLANMAEGQ